MYFTERGYTTAGAFSQFRVLKEKNIEVIKISPDDMNQMLSIINNADCKKHKQTKLGVGLLFCTVLNNNEQEDFMLEPHLIVNLTRRQNYLITNQADQIWLKGFIQQLKDKFLAE